MLGVPFWAFVASRIDKKPTFMISIILSTVFLVTPILLKINGYWPSREDIELYLGLLGGMGFLVAFGGAAGMVAAGSMMADLVDEHELATGRRQEGIFFGALAFSSKCSSGIGHQLAGWGIDLIHFPAQAEPGTVPPEIVRNLGILYGPGIAFIAGISLLFLIRYRLTRAGIDEIQQALAQRRATAGSPS